MKVEEIVPNFKIQPIIIDLGEIIIDFNAEETILCILLVLELFSILSKKY